MALDTKAKRGSVMLLTLPGRPWLPPADSSLTALDRVVLLYYAGAITPDGTPPETPTFFGLWFTR